MMAAVEEEVDRELDDGQESSSKKGIGGPEKLPLLIEVSISISRLIIILVVVGMAIASIMMKVAPMMAILRIGAGVLLIGLIVWGSNMLLVRNTLQAIQRELGQDGHPDAHSHTMEWEV
jgi:hypothetical protein